MELTGSDKNDSQLAMETMGRLNIAQSIIKDQEAEIFRLQEVVEFYAKLPNGDVAKAALAQRSWFKSEE